MAALIASEGVIFILIQAKEITKFILPEGEDPGLKSVAKQSGSPLEIISLAGVYRIPKKKEHDGKATGIVLLFSNAL